MRDADVLIAMALSPWEFAQQAAENGPAGDPWHAQRAAITGDLAHALEFGAPQLPPLPREVVAVIEAMASVPVYCEDEISEAIDLLVYPKTIRVGTDISWTLEGE